MTKFTYKNIEVTVFNGYDGDQIFLSNGYSARTNRAQGEIEAKKIIDLYY